jgi:mycofactocin precursor
MEPTVVVEEPASVAAQADSATTDIVDEDLLVEDVSIDGMCGVY